MKPPLDSFILSPLQQDDISVEDIVKKLRGRPGEDGDDGKDGVDSDPEEVASILYEPILEDLGEELRNDADFLKKVTPKISKPETIDIVEIAERVTRLVPQTDEKKLLKKFLSEVPKAEKIEPETADQVVRKINKADVKINKSQIKGFDIIESEAKSANSKIQKYLLMGGSTLVKLQSNGVPLGDFSTLNFVNGTITNTSGTANYTSTGGAGGSGYQATLSGSLGQAVFTWTTAPNVITIDGTSYQKVQKDGTVMWTGTTTTTLTGAPQPNFDIFSPA